MLFVVVCEDEEEAMLMHMRSEGADDDGGHDTSSER